MRDCPIIKDLSNPQESTLNQRAVGSTPTRPTTNQPLTHHPPSSRSPCRHSVGSKAEKYIFWPSQAGPQIYIDEVFLNLTQGMRYDCSPYKNKSSKPRFVDKTFLTDHVPRAPRLTERGRFFAARVVPRLKCRQIVEHCELSFLQRIQPASSPLSLRDISAHSLATLVRDLRLSPAAMGLE